jgi:hypothetical protein
MNKHRSTTWERQRLLTDENSTLKKKEERMRL